MYTHGSIFSVSKDRSAGADSSIRASGRTMLACVLAVMVAACGDSDWDTAMIDGAQAETRSVESSASVSAVSAKPADATSGTQPTLAEAGAAAGPAIERVSGAATEDWVDVLVNDMKLYHDGPARTLQWIRTWGDSWVMPKVIPKPAGWTTAGAWGVILADYAGAGTPPQPWRVSGPYTGNRAPNTRAQVRDMQLWWLTSDGKWVLGSHSKAPGGNMYHSSWAGDKQTSQNDIRDESNNGGGRSARYINMNSGGYNLDEYHWHFYGSRAQVPSNYVGFATAYFARKILHDPNGPDDRANARLLADTAGDWWITADAQWDNFKTNGPMGHNRYKYLTNEWQIIGFHSLTEAQLRANPPPIIGR